MTSRSDDRPPFAGYEGLDDRQVIKELSKHSQVELEAVESYERSHANRKSVLDKLHFMRETEPVPGYDTLDPDEIEGALGKADLGTIKAIRAYERKFANRRVVLVDAARALRRRQSLEPRGPAPGYEPMSASTRGNPSPGVDRLA